jgi:hypothetical protein
VQYQGVVLATVYLVMMKAEMKETVMAREKEMMAIRMGAIMETPEPKMEMEMSLPFLDNNLSPSLPYYWDF